MGVTRSYSSRPFLCALDAICYAGKRQLVKEHLKSLPKKGGGEGWALFRVFPHVIMKEHSCHV